MSIRINWRPFIREEMPREEMEVVKLSCFTIFKPARNVLKSDIWTKNKNGAWSFLHSGKEDVRAYSMLKEFEHLPWKPFIPEEIPRKEMELLFFNRLTPEIIHKLTSDTWKRYWTEWGTECLQQFSYARYCPLDQITLPEN